MLWRGSANDMHAVLLDDLDDDEVVGRRHFVRQDVQIAVASQCEAPLPSVGPAVSSSS